MNMIDILCCQSDVSDEFERFDRFKGFDRLEDMQPEYLQILTAHSPLLCADVSATLI